MQNSLLPYSTSLISGNTLYISGQLPLDSQGKMPTSIKEQTNQCLLNIESILKDNGYSLNDVIKTTVFITNFTKFSEMNDEYIKHFHNRKPVRTACGVVALAKNASIEIDCIACKKGD